MLYPLCCTRSAAVPATSAKQASAADDVDKLADEVSRHDHHRASALEQQGISHSAHAHVIAATSDLQLAARRQRLLPWSPRRAIECAPSRWLGPPPAGGQGGC
jgi:hypothetical protein